MGQHEVSYISQSRRDVQQPSITEQLSQDANLEDGAWEGEQEEERAHTEEGDEAAGTTPDGNFDQCRVEGVYSVL